MQNSVCRWPRVGRAWAFRTLWETLEGPGPMSSFWGTWIGFLRVSGGETSILVAEEEQLIGLELDEDDLVWNF